MKLENLPALSKAGEEYERAKNNLEFVRDKSVYFYANSAPTSAAGSLDVSLSMGGASGQLATDIRAAMIRFREAHLGLAEQKLRELGIEIPAKK